MRSEWRAGTAVAAGMLAIMLVTSQCGGHPADNFGTGTGGEPSPSESPGPTGSAVLIEFVAPSTTTTDTPASDGSTVFQSSIGPVGTSNPQGS